MLYSIVGYDVENSLELRAQVRHEHVARLKVLEESGHLVIAGPNPAIDCNEPGAAGMTGSIIIAKFKSLDDAKEWAAEDPYLKTGVYRKVEVKPFKQVLPSPEEAQD
ncbi:YciI family protein [Thiomicrorhabdus sp. 6S3-12]|uniref:YciI family protein n=1 Tax=Thiomicrorhabdus sp. 6S3-12 TaxID=2819681 RepID=UPI001AADC1F9|nr:YciI family protein [Thiomicrorhabdus sp. 6S3-12]MBO1925161.1 YciI family protein [Thiomicrorhabdus sp. 6S3-12]